MKVGIRHEFKVAAKARLRIKIFLKFCISVVYTLNIYGPRSEGDNVLGTVCPSVSALTALSSAAKSKEIHVLLTTVIYLIYE